jgi:hypothetical protein
MEKLGISGGSRGRFATPAGFSLSSPDWVEGYTYRAKVCGLLIVEGPSLSRPCQKPESFDSQPLRRCKPAAA